MTSKMRDRLPPALRHRDFALFWAGSALSGVGTQFTTVAMAWQIYELTDSPLQIGLLGLARAVPQIAMAIFGGLLADTMDRKRLMAGLQIVQWATSATLAALTAFHLSSPEALYAGAVLLALASAVEQPARGAVVANLVPPHDLRSGVALHMVQRQVGSVAGPGLAGLALTFAGPGWCYAADAASWLAMLAAVLLVRTPLQSGSQVQPWSLETLLGGARFVMTQPVIFWFMVLDFGATLFGSPNALLPVFARDILAVGPTGLGMLYAASSAGGLAAATFLSASSRLQAAGKWVLVGVVVYGAAIMLFAVTVNFWIALAMLALSGAGNGLSAVLRGTSNQLLTPDNLRGRVGAFNNAFVTGGPQLGQFESGVIAELFGPQVSALTGGIGALLLALGIATIPVVRRFQLTAHTAPPVVTEP